MVSQTREDMEQATLDQFKAMAANLKAKRGPVLMDIDLTLAQLRTMVVLAEDGPLVIGQIAQRLGIGLSTGGHLVERLVQAGLAERAEDTEDRRRSVARLTPAGEELYARMLSGIHELPSLLQQLHEDDLAALLQGLQALNQLAAQKTSTTMQQAK